eukprot:35074-Chlamydomonas_euryale.AAC.1
MPILECREMKELPASLGSLVYKISSVQQYSQVGVDATLYAVVSVTLTSVPFQFDAVGERWGCDNGSGCHNIPAPSRITVSLKHEHKQNAAARLNPKLLHTYFEAENALLLT